MLHILNGDTVADQLNKGHLHDHLEGDLLVWREIFTEGALYTNMQAPNLLHARAESLQCMLGIPQSTYIEGVLAQEKRLSQAMAGKESIVLWFEHDLFDQTILWYLLYRLQRAEAAPDRCFLLSIDSYPGIDDFRGMGQLTASQLQTLIGTWKPLTLQHLSLGAKAWIAYTAQTPEQLAQLLKEDTSALPYLADAVRSHLQRFPSVRNGLSTIEQRTLECLEREPQSPSALFRAVSKALPLYGMGDLQYWHTLKQLHIAVPALIRFAVNREQQRSGSRPDEAPPFPNFQTDAGRDFLQRHLEITEAGREILTGKADKISRCGIAIDLGGVHLHVEAGSRRPVWRWDDAGEQLIQK